jgi:hypothetical protein
VKETDPSLTLPFVILHRFGPVPIPFPFPLAPQRVRWRFPAPVSIQRTASRPYLNDFSGQDQVAAGVTIQGTFGYMPSVGVVGFSIPVPGSISLKLIETTFETFNALDRQLKKDIGAAQELIVPSRLHYWQVSIREFSYDISNANPLLYFYTIVIDRLLDYLSPVGPQLPTGVPGVTQGLGDALGGLVGAAA